MHCNIFFRIANSNDFYVANNSSIWFNDSTFTEIVTWKRFFSESVTWKSVNTKTFSSD